jgi:photosystem II oxygen-evolving enhancer protein 2
MLKSLLSLLLIFLAITISSCSASLGGLQSYIDASDGYQFLYPNGWIPVDVKNASEGVDVVFQDFIERGENLSVIISDINQDKQLADLGTPTDVGYRFMEMVNNNPNSQREAELISATKKEYNLKNYYLLEYQVTLPNNQVRHNLASVVTNKGKLYTFNISTSESRWQAVKDLFKAVANSFSLS